MNNDCAINQRFIYGLNCSGVVYFHKIFQIDVNCARIGITPLNRITNMTFNKNDSLVSFSSDDSNNTF